MTSDTDREPVLDAPADWVEYAVGSPEFRGRTTVRVEGDGRALVRSTEGDRERAFEATLDDDAMADLRETLASHDPRDLRSERDSGVPDEARIRIRLSADGTEHAREFWGNERWEVDGLGALVDAFDGIAADVSGGEVTY